MKSSLLCQYFQLVIKSEVFHLPEGESPVIPFARVNMSILNSSWLECLLRTKGIFIFRSILANKYHPKARPECLTGFLTNEADICCICPSFSCWSQLVNQALQVLNCCTTSISLTDWVKSQSGIQTQVFR